MPSCMSTGRGSVNIPAMGKREVGVQDRDVKRKYDAYHEAVLSAVTGSLYSARRTPSIRLRGFHPHGEASFKHPSSNRHFMTIIHLYQMLRQIACARPTCHPGLFRFGGISETRTWQIVCLLWVPTSPMSYLEPAPSTQGICSGGLVVGARCIWLGMPLGTNVPIRCGIHQAAVKRGCWTSKLLSLSSLKSDAPPAELQLQCPTP